MNTIKVNLLNNGTYEGLESVVFPVIVDGTLYNNNIVDVSYKELTRIGGRDEEFSEDDSDMTLCFFLVSECEIATISGEEL